MNARFGSVRGVCLLQLLMLIGVAVVRVSGAPVSTKEVVGTVETVAKNNELNNKEKAVSANTESASYSPKSSSNSTQPEAPVKRSLTSSKIERAPMNPTPVRSSSSVRINPVPGQMERVLSSASSQMRKGSKPGSSEEEGRRMSDEDNEFLEDMGVENEEEDKAPAAAAELEASSENQQWRELLADQRIQDLMANRYNQDQQQQQDFGDSYPSASSSSSSSSQSLDTRALTDYLVRTGEIDRTLHDLVAAGVMTSEEATLYREAINLEYGAGPQSTNNNDQMVVDPEVIYDDGQPSEVLYDGPNYIQPFPVDYQLPVGDYLNLAPQSLQQQQQQIQDEDEEEGETMGRSDGDYGQSAGSRFKDNEEEDQEQQQEEATNELLRDLLGTIALQEDNGKGLSYKSSLPSEMEVQRPNLPSSTNHWSPVGKEVDDERGTDVEKELEALPTTGERIETDGTLEEQQLEEMRNRVRPEKTKQDNRTKPLKNSH